MTDAELIQAFALDDQRNGLAATTLRLRGVHLRALSSWLAQRDLDLAGATHDDLAKFLDDRQCSNKTRSCWISTFRAFYRSDAIEGRIGLDPTAKLRTPKLARNLPRPISDADLARAIEVARRKGLTTIKACLLLGSFAGLRCQEIAGLLVGDIDVDHATVRVSKSKGGYERFVPLHLEVRDCLAIHIDGRHAQDPLLLNYSGNPLSASWVSRTLSTFFRTLEIPATAHQMRHLFGTMVYRNTLDLRLTQELMGHSSPVTTAVYAAHDPAGAAAAVASLNISGCR